VIEFALDTAAPTSNPELRLLSVIIPARDEEKCIAVKHLHLELELQNVPHEIVVVDDHSTDRTWETLQRVAQEISKVRPTQNGGEGGFGRAIAWGLDHMKIRRLPRRGAVLAKAQ
jgi:dolichol-phosphate mannosyltransferase